MVKVAASFPNVGGIEFLPGNVVKVKTSRGREYGRYFGPVTLSTDVLAALNAKRRDLNARKERSRQERAGLVLSPDCIKISKLESGNGITIELPDGYEVTFAMVEGIRYAVMSAIGESSHKHE